MKTKLEIYMPVAGTVIPIEKANNYLINDMVGGTGVCIIPQGDKVLT